jgi:hypothetical protein
MILTDAGGSVWKIRHIRWQGPRQWIPVDPHKSAPTRGVMSCGFEELVPLAADLVLVAASVSLGTQKYLVKLTIRPFWLRLQPSPRHSDGASTRFGSHRPALPRTRRRRCPHAGTGPSPGRRPIPAATAHRAAVAHPRGSRTSGIAEAFQTTDATAQTQ